jgi:hypothetical protein
MMQNGGKTGNERLMLARGSQITTYDKVNLQTSEREQSTFSSMSQRRSTANGLKMLPLVKKMAKKNVTTMEMRCLVEKLRDIDHVQQLFSAILFLELRIRGCARDENLFKAIEGQRLFRDKFEFPNSISTTRLRDTVERDSDDIFITLVVDGTFGCMMDLHAFPFDYQSLPIMFTVNCSDQSRTPVQLVVNPDVPSKVTLSNFTLANVWNVGNVLYLKPSRSDPEESGKRKTYPRMEISMRVRRRPGFYINNLILPTALFPLLAMLSYCIELDFHGEYKESTSNRITMTLSLYLTAAVFRVSVADRVPAITYQTRADVYVRSVL